MEIPIPERDLPMINFLAEAGIEKDVTRAALDIDAVLQNWRRRYFKRELGHDALAALGLDKEMDLAQLDVLVAIWAPSNEFGEDAKQETMIATVAERLRIDPSRASRQVSEMIARGLARRDVSQQDGRRTIVTLTPRGEAIVQAARQFKYLVMGEFLSSWTAEEIATFMPLLERFSVWSENSAGIGPERFTAEIRQIIAEMNAVKAD